MNLAPIYYLHKNIRTKWIKDLILKPEMLKLLEETISITLQDTEVGNKFLSNTAFALGSVANN